MAEVILRNMLQSRDPDTIYRGRIGGNMDSRKKSTTEEEWSHVSVQGSLLSYCRWQKALFWRSHKAKSKAFWLGSIYIDLPSRSCAREWKQTEIYRAEHGRTVRIDTSGFNHCNSQPETCQSQQRLEDQAEWIYQHALELPRPQRQWCGLLRSATFSQFEPRNR